MFLEFWYGLTTLLRNWPNSSDQQKALCSGIGVERLLRLHPFLILRLGYNSNLRHSTFTARKLPARSKEDRTKIDLFYVESLRHVPKTRLNAPSIEQSGESQYRLLVSPQSLLQKGNSDPFSKAAIPITSFNNHLINIWRSVFLEALWPVEAGSSTAALLVWSAHSKAMIETEILLHAVLGWTTSLLIGAMLTSHARTTLSPKAFEYNS